MSNLRYRPEIDGLRAVAVLGVVLYHMGLGFPGGYVGVDVFFVISGFLITGIIVKDLNRGTFSMLDFWVRRIRRIMPAVTVMVVVCLIAGYVLLSPDAFKGLAKSSIAQSLMAANVYFWRDTGYFTESAEFKPLLHTWSLAVEEQFYVFFPLVLFVFWKWWKHQVIPVLLILGGFSFLLSCIGVVYYPQATFFLLPARAWEMLAGGVLAVWSGKKKIPHKSSEIIAWAGLLMIAYSMLFYSHDTLFPGWTALLPVLGSVLFIGANKGTMTSAGRLLSVKPMVFIGLISYSLYLWHWPLLAFARSIVIDINLPWKLAILAGSMISAIISWRFVETPFRKKNILSTKSSAYSFGAASTVVVLIMSVVIWKSNGVPNRVDDNMALLIEDIDWTGSEYINEGSSLIYLGIKSPNEKSKVDFVLWGDSHGMAVSSTIDDLAREHGLHGVAFLNSGRAPVLGVNCYLDSADEREENDRSKQSIIQFIEKNKVENLILVARWNSYFDANEMPKLKDTAIKGLMRVVDSDCKKINKAKGSILKRSLREMVERLKGANVKIYILKQVPSISDQHCAKHVFMLKRYPTINQMQDTLNPKLDPLILRDNADKAIEGVEKLAVILDSNKSFFDSSGKVKVYSERSYYRDTGHLTRYGAKHYLSGLFNKFFDEINNSEKNNLNIK